MVVQCHAPTLVLAADISSPRVVTLISLQLTGEEPSAPVSVAAVFDAGPPLSFAHFLRLNNAGPPVAVDLHEYARRVEGVTAAVGHIGNCLTCGGHQAVGLCRVGVGAQE